MIDYTKDPIYKQKVRVTEVTLPSFPFICIKGKGNPNCQDFSFHVSALYAVAYAIKMSPHKGWAIPGYEPFKVYPLEGIWDMTQHGRTSEVFDKNELIYTIMIRQPSFVTKEVFNEALALVNKKNASHMLEQVYFDTIKDGHCIQTLHLGSFDEEPRSFDLMKLYAKQHGLERRSFDHREIYLSDVRKLPPEKFRTILRYFLK
ncbi:MAG: GyrI-like domain-containing protein [Firmicutes bacterium]|nr:GyrI-like domain-containing protein [Bacillota bacterium]